MQTQSLCFGKCLKPFHAWRRRRRQWCLAQSADLSPESMKDLAFKFHQPLQVDCMRVLKKQTYIYMSTYIWQDQIADYSKLKHCDFMEGYLMNDLDELRDPWRKKVTPVHDEIVID